MTREEIRIKRELTKEIEKKLLKPVSKRHGYKNISGIPYRVCDEFLYTIYISTMHNEIRLVINVKPLVIDNIFWEAFDMKEEAEKQPFSFHVIAAFVPHSHWLEDWRLPISSVEQAEAVLEQAFTETDSKIAMYCEQIKTIQDFKKLLQGSEHINQLNCILCDIAIGDYKEALAKTKGELSKGHRGGFASIEGGDIYEYVQRYCESHLINL